MYRSGLLANGKVLVSGAPAEIRSRPAVLHEYLGMTTEVREEPGWSAGLGVTAGPERDRIQR